MPASEPSPPPLCLAGLVGDSSRRPHRGNRALSGRGGWGSPPRRKQAALTLKPPETRPLRPPPPRCRSSVPRSGPAHGRPFHTHSGPGRVPRHRGAQHKRDTAIHAPPGQTLQLPSARRAAAQRPAGGRGQLRQRHAAAPAL